MSKKLIRLKSPKIEDLQNFVGRDLDFVLKNGIVYFGVLKKIEGDQLFFSDKINNKHIITFGDLQEVVADEIHQF